MQTLEVGKPVRLLEGLIEVEGQAEVADWPFYQKLISWYTRCSRRALVAELMIVFPLLALFTLRHNSGYGQTYTQTRTDI